MLNLVESLRASCVYDGLKKKISAKAENSIHWGGGGQRRLPVCTLRFTQTAHGRGRLKLVHLFVCP